MLRIDLDEFKSRIETYVVETKKFAQPVFEYKSANELELKLTVWQLLYEDLYRVVRLFLSPPTVVGLD